MSDDKMDVAMTTLSVERRGQMAYLVMTTPVAADGGECVHRMIFPLDAAMSITMGRALVATGHEIQNDPATIAGEAKP